MITRHLILYNIFFIHNNDILKINIDKNGKFKMIKFDFTVNNSMK